MMDSRTKESAGRLCGVMAFTFLLVLVPALKFDFYYDLNDDTAIKDILSGACTGTPSGYSIQMLFPLSWLIAVCYRAVPTLPWYGLFLCVCQFGVLALIAWRLLCLAKSRSAKIAALAVEAVMALGIFIRELVIVQYSVTSGFCMAGAAFLFLTGRKTDKLSAFLKQNAISVLLVMLSFMIRTEVCMMLLPFLLFSGLVKWGSEDRIFTGNNFRKYLMLLGSALLGILVVLCLDIVAYQGSDWSSFKKFFDARTKIYDFYGLPLYDNENAAFYDSIGLSKESYTLLENYNFALDESIDSWMLESIAEYQKQQAQMGNGLHSTLGYVSRNSLTEALWLYKNHCLSVFAVLRDTFLGPLVGADRTLTREVVARYMVAGGYLLYMLLCFLPSFLPREADDTSKDTHSVKKGQVVFKILGLLLIRGILWIYLYMVDRAISRVTMPLLMMEFVVLMGFLCSDWQRNRAAVAGVAGTIMHLIIGVLCLLFLGTACIFNFKSTVNEYAAREHVNSRWTALMNYCREKKENYYVIDVYSSTSYDGVPYSEKMFRDVDNTYKNFDICGGWVAKSPLYKEKLERSGLKDVQSALYSQKVSKAAAKTYFVAACDKDLFWLEAYYQNRGFEIEAVCADTVTDAEGEPVFFVYEVHKE